LYKKIQKKVKSLQTFLKKNVKFEKNTKMQKIQTKSKNYANIV